MKKIALLQSNYIPWKGYFDLIHYVDEFYYYDEVQYTKNDWRNRNQILSPSGKMWLTIPVRHEYLGQSIRDIKVLNNRWQKKHWKSILTNYAKSPNFDLLKDYLQELYLSELPSNLSQINEIFNKSILDILGVKTKTFQSFDLDLKGDRNERIIDLCNKVNADVYVSGSMAKSYIDLDQFTSAGIHVEWFEYQLNPYPQLWIEKFDPYVSVLDYILNREVENI